METDFKNQEELETVFEESPVEVPDEQAVTAAYDDLFATSTALEHLNDLLYTIGKEGVSQEDYNTVVAVIEKLGEKGIDVQMGVALEDFGSSHFTQARSRINLRVSQEGFVQTVIELIKKAIQALIDYLTKAIRVARSFNHKDAVIERKIQSVLKSVEEARKGADDLIKVSPFPVKIQEEEIKYAAELLNEENQHIRRSRLTVACYGVGSEATALVELHTNVRSACSQLVASIRDLDRFLAGTTGVLDIPRSMDFSWQSKLSAEITEFLMEQPAAGYIAQKVKVDVFNVPPKSAVLPYEFLLDAYQSSADTLRKIRKVNIEDDPELANAVTEIITMLTEGYEVLGRAVDFFSRLRYTQLVVLGQYYKYHNRRYTLAWEYISQNVVSDSTTRAMEMIHKRVSQKLREHAI